MRTSPPDDSLDDLAKYLNDLAEKSPAKLVALVISFLLLPIIFIASIVGLGQKLVYEYKGYETHRYRHSPSETTYIFGGYNFTSVSVNEYRPLDKLPPPLTDVIDIYPNAKIFRGNLSFDRKEVYWFDGSLYIHSPDELEQIIQFYENSVRNKPNVGNIQPSIIGIEFYEKDGKVNRFDISKLDEQGAISPIRPDYPEIPENHHIYHLHFKGKSDPVRVK